MASDSPGPRRVPARDWVLIPLVMLATLLFLLAPAELASRALFPDAEIDACAASSSGALHGLPNCVTRMRAPEGEWAEIAYNSCGYRTPEPCGPKPPGALRVAVIGASTSAGYLTPYADTMAARAAARLTRACGRAVEFQNLAAAGNYGAKLVASAAEAVTLAPDALAMVISPIDFEKAADAAAASAPPDHQARRGLIGRLRDTLASSRLLYMEAFAILRNDDTYVPMFLNSGAKADFLRAPPPEAWARKLGDFDGVIGQIATIAAGRAPVVVVFMPQRAQAALAASDRFAGAFDPEALPEAIRQIVERHGLVFVDVTRAIPREAPTDTLYYAMNGHPNGRGHALMADSLTRRMLAPDFSPFGALCRPD